MSHVHRWRFREVAQSATPGTRIEHYCSICHELLVSASDVHTEGDVIPVLTTDGRLRLWCVEANGDLYEIVHNAPVTEDGKLRRH